MSTHRSNRRRGRRLQEKSRRTGRKKTYRQNWIGKIIVLFQLVFSVLFTAVVWDSNLLPAKYFAALGITLLVLFAVFFGMQYVKNKIYILGIVLSVLVSLLLGFGSYYLVRTSQMLENVGGATYKTDNMIVVVRTGDSAETIQDALNYTFGMQTSLDQENNHKMLVDLKEVMGKEPEVTDYTTLQEEAQALLDGEIDAAIYNEAFTSIIEEAIEGYTDEVRVLYQYGISTVIEPEETETDRNVKEPFNIYISGIDVSGDITTTSRSDVNIIMTVNPNTNKILLTTTPRDYYVYLPGVSGDQRDKLTHAGIYGVDESMVTLESLYGIDIAYYARVNFTSLIKIVDALGGVDVYSEYAFEGRGYQFTEGLNHMDGEAALAFARERYSFESGDNQRGKNQEALLTAIIQKAMTPAILTKANQIIASVGDSVETNMTRAEMTEFISDQLADGASWSIESTAATGTGDTRTCYSSGDQLLYVMWPNEDSVAEISEKMKQILEEQ